MEKDLIERYKNEMLKMYQRKAKVIPAVAEPEQEAAVPLPPASNSEEGYLMAVVTAVRSLYFVPNAKVTVFTGGVDDMNVIATAVTDQNGRTEKIPLPAPAVSLSQSEDNSQPPYSLYNIMVEADGYLTNIHLNIPVFSSVTSRQLSNLLLLETAGVNKGPRIFDEMPNYNL